MNNKTNFLGYSQAVGLTTNASTTLTTNCNGTVNTYSDGNWATPLNLGSVLTYSNESDYNSISTEITNSKNMNKQVKVAVFTVERNEDKNKISGPPQQQQEHTANIQSPVRVQWFMQGVGWGFEKNGFQMKDAEALLQAPEIKQHRAQALTNRFWAQRQHHSPK
jgi:hypothetical protein